jgi:hypothetical protein
VAVGTGDRGWEVDKRRMAVPAASPHRPGGLRHFGAKCREPEETAVVRRRKPLCGAEGVLASGFAPASAIYSRNGRFGRCAGARRARGGVRLSFGAVFGLGDETGHEVAGQLWRDSGRRSGITCEHSACRAFEIRRSCPFGPAYVVFRKFGRSTSFQLRIAKTVCSSLPACGSLRRIAKWYARVCSATARKSSCVADGLRKCGGIG